ncbi:hypothetical protein JQ625_09225 [Bradyrhizobium diazoefficiens]|nr:hypothetical protein [Bradyrhizobium diazoefficiens]MBR0775013.1 hypothetical protein [Bradyrhizobium diazoefficiens]
MTADAKDLIVFVHGTGSANPADEGKKWWQLGSSFSNELGALLQSCAVVARPFHWSGLNSELARRRAGSILLERLQQMEASGQRYHLVGHSHGGSVIWHALTQSAAQGRRLAGLKGWCTVGTPYLTVAPRWPNVWRWVTALLVTIAFSSLLYSSGALELPSVAPEIWSDGRRWSLIGYLALMSAAVALWIWAVGRALLPAAARLLYSSQLGIPATAAGWYGETWLGLWHPLDEPINSLAGTLGPAPKIAPRRKESLLFRTIPFLGSVWDAVLLRAADEFAWRQVTNRAQGADLVNQFVLDVGRAPKSLEPGFNPLPAQLAGEMTASANEHSEGLVASMRALLENAYDQRNTETIADRLGTLLTFQELIHTSYFGQSAVTKMIAAHIEQCAAPGGRPLTAFEPARADVASARKASALPPRSALEFVTALVLLIAPAATLWVSVRTTAEAVITPYTAAFQFESIKDYVTQRRVLAAGSGGRLAALLLGLEAKGVVVDPITMLDRIPEDKHRWQAAIRLAYGYGRSGRIKDVERLLAREQPEGQAAYDANIRLLAFLGNAARRDTSAQPPSAVEGLVPARSGSTDVAPAFLALIDFYLDHLQDTSDLVGPVGTVLPQLGLLGLVDRGQRILDIAAIPGRQFGPERMCDLTTALAEGVAVASPNANIAGLVEQCPIDNRRGIRVDLKGIMKRKVATQVLLARKSSGLLVHAAANDFRPLSQDQIEDAIFTAKDEDELAAKVREFLPDIILLEQTLSREQIALISRNDSWAARVARNSVSPVAMLARIAFELDAKQLSNALLDLLMLKHAGHIDVIEALAACGRQDAARQQFLKYVDEAGSRKSEEVDVRLTTLVTLIMTASRLADDASVARFADELLREQIKEPKSETLIGMAGAVAPVWRVDPVRGRVLLAAALDYASLLDGDAARDSVTRAVAGEMTRQSAIRKARLTALQITETDGALKALLAIVKHDDKQNSYDFRELGPAASDVQNMTEEPDGR